MHQVNIQSENGNTIGGLGFYNHQHEHMLHPLLMIKSYQRCRSGSYTSVPLYTSTSGPTACTADQLNDGMKDCRAPNNQRDDCQRDKANEHDQGFTHSGKRIVGVWFSVGLIQKIREIEHDQGDRRIGKGREWASLRFLSNHHHHFVPMGGCCLARCGRRWWRVVSRLDALPEQPGLGQKVVRWRGRHGCSLSRNYQEDFPDLFGLMPQELPSLTHGTSLPL